MLTFSEFAVVAIVALFSALAGLAFLRMPQRQHPDHSDAPQGPLSLLFDDGFLHHGTDAALRQFAFLPGTHVWDDLRDALLQYFPEFPETPGTGTSGSMQLQSKDPRDQSVIDVNWRDGLCWVHISDLAKQETDLSSLPAHHIALVRCCETLAHPAWETDDDNNIIWYNSAFEAVIKAHPTTTALADLNTQRNPQRLALGDPDGATNWFEVTAHPTEAGHMRHATNITPLVKAEEAQRTFVQTLAKTFAHLSIGLAIFDRRGQLGIFNPALVDLTGLQANFLAGQPTMMSFFDALRENRRMPEPKNYKTWRQDIAEVIAAASGGQYRETWTLEDGRTYVVQGRPHPDGATAFLIEDISAEVTLSRSFRADMEQFETLLDNIDDALAVFSSAGVLTFCNAAYRNMWGQNPEAAFADVTITDAVALWSKTASTKGGWDKVTEFAKTIGHRTATDFAVRFANETTLQCTLSPLAYDATLIRFSHAPLKAGIMAPTKLDTTI